MEAEVGWGGVQVHPAWGLQKGTQRLGCLPEATSDFLHVPSDPWTLGAGREHADEQG